MHDFTTFVGYNGKEKKKKKTIASKQTQKTRGKDRGRSIVLFSVNVTNISYHGWNIHVMTVLMLFIW